MSATGMKVYGIDFTSAPGSKKPIACARGASHRTGGLVIHEIERLTGFGDFEAFLDQKGPWFAGLDAPLGLPWPFLNEVGLPNEWTDYVSEIWQWEKPGFLEKVRSYKDGKPAGEKEPLRITDSLAKSKSPLKIYQVPVGKMFFEAAPRLLASEVSVLPYRPSNDNRKVVEAYPALIARRFPGKYKVSGKGGDAQAIKTARQRILSALVSPEVFLDFGFRVELNPVVVTEALEDGQGDILDAVLCAVQAAWSYQKGPPNFGIPRGNHPVISAEGWIVDPGLVN